MIDITASGAITKLAGGSFQDGARSEAFVYLFNHMAGSYSDTDNVCTANGPSCDNREYIQHLKTAGEIGSWTNPGAWAIRAYNYYDDGILLYNGMVGNIPPLEVVPRMIGFGTERLYRDGGMNHNWSVRGGNTSEFYMNQGINGNDDYISP